MGDISTPRIRQPEFRSVKGMLKRICRAIAITSGLLMVGPPTTATGQFVGLDFGGAISGYRELNGAVGGDFSIGIPIVAGLELTAHLGEMVAFKDWNRSSCIGFVPPDATCHQSLFEGTFSLFSLGAGIQLHHDISPRTGAFFAVDFSNYRVSGTWRSHETGTGLGPMPRDPGNGWGIQVGMDRKVWGNNGFRLSIRRDAPEFSNCGADAYFAFCERKAVYSIRIGLQRRVKRRP